MSYKINTICLQLEEKVYKIFSISAGKDGSIYIHVPYCKAKKGYVFRHAVDYKRGILSYSRPTNEFIVSNDIKLTMHPSGFVQFSGYEHNKIISGWNTEKNRAKGVGVTSAPLNNPIQSGPTALISSWGIEDGFKKLPQKSKKGRLNILFQEKDFIIEKLLGEPNTYIFELFIFPPEFTPILNGDDRGKRVTLSFPMYMHPGAIFTFPILDLMGLKNTVGIIPFKRHSDFSVENKYGYMLNGPSELTRDKKGKKVFEAIGCSYPRIFGDDYKSLNFEPVQ